MSNVLQKLKKWSNFVFVIFFSKYCVVILSYIPTQSDEFSEAEISTSRTLVGKGILSANWHRMFYKPFLGL